MRVIAYAYDADHHCKSCMLDYARAVEYRDYEFGEYSDEDIKHDSAACDGIIDLMKAVELEIIRDSEGNPIHPVFSIDEWYNIGEGDQTLACSDCGGHLDEYEDND